MVNATVADVNVTQTTRAQLVSAKCQMRAAVPPMTLCAMAEEPANATTVSVRRDTSGQNVKNASAVLTLARPN